VAGEPADRLAVVGDFVDNGGGAGAHAGHGAFGVGVPEFAAMRYGRARWYDPARGRFVSRDPVGFAAGDANLYRYVRNTPPGTSDPLGLMPNDRDVITLDELIRRIEVIENLSMNDRKTAFEVLSSVPNFIGWKYLYMCKSGDTKGSKPGYIDTYHFFNSAKSSSGPVSGAGTYAFGYVVEGGQWLWGFIAPLGGPNPAPDPFGNPNNESSPNGNKSLGNAASAFTMEDIPSNWWGTQFGQYVYENPDSSLSTLVRNFFNSQLGGPCSAPNPSGLPPTERDWQNGWYRNTWWGRFVQRLADGLTQ
jgi:hypothetical protein